MAVKKVALISVEGMEFVMERRVAMASSSLRELIHYYDEFHERAARFNEQPGDHVDAEKVRLALGVSSPTLERLCTRLCHCYRQSSTAEMEPLIIINPDL